MVSFDLYRSRDLQMYFGEIWFWEEKAREHSETETEVNTKYLARVCSQNSFWLSSVHGNIWEIIYFRYHNYYIYYIYSQIRCNRHFRKGLKALDLSKVTVYEYHTRSLNSQICFDIELLLENSSFVSTLFVSSKA